MIKTILVTGAGGQLGLTLKELAIGHPDIRFVFKTSKELDITINEEVKSIFAEEKFDYCINCAAYTDVEQAEQNPIKAFEVNAEGVKNLAESCLIEDVVLIHISTDYVFDGEKSSPYLPNDIPNPINEYGKSKLEGEKHIQRILKRFYIVRTSWLYSKKYGQNFYKTIIEKASKGEILRITDQEIGCPTNTASLSRFLIEKLIAKDPTFGIYHHTNGVAMSWFDFAKIVLMENALERETKIVADSNYRTFAKRPRNSVLSLQNN